MKELLLKWLLTRLSQSRKEKEKAITHITKAGKGGKAKSFKECIDYINMHF